MASTTEHVVQWVTPSPLWLGAGAAPSSAAMKRPAILAFKSDDFMNEIIDVLASKRPADVASFLASWESDRAPPAGAKAGWKAPPPTPPAPPLKLYQPTHGRFYLVAASLVCRLPGLPDRSVDPAQEERAGFVLRRTTTEGAVDVEWAWAWADAAKKKRVWSRVPLGAEESVRDGEEIFPLFPLAVRDGDRRRRVLAGLVPTSSRETFVTTDVADDADPEEKVDPRRDRAEAQIFRPYEALKAPLGGVFGGAGGDAAARLAARREASYFLLLDLAERLAADFSSPGADVRKLNELFAGHHVDVAGITTWETAIAAAAEQQATLLAQGREGEQSLDVDLGESELDSAKLRDTWIEALGKEPPPWSPPAGGVDVPKLDGKRATRYRLRCVLQRPRCGPLHPDVVSKPSDDFAIAQFFDPDAPSRPIRIPMPIDTSVAGLRKFKKNVGFVLSDHLRKQMCRVTDLKKVLDGDLGTCDEPSIGQICSLSIPIITICALIVLMIFVYLLNIIFWWVPFLKFCFPIRLTRSE